MIDGNEGALSLVFHLRVLFTSPSLLKAFGAPFIIAHIDGRKETLFGGDRLELLAFKLGAHTITPSQHTCTTPPSLHVQCHFVELYTQIHIQPGIRHIHVSSAMGVSLAERKVSQK